MLVSQKYEWAYMSEDESARDLKGDDELLEANKNLSLKKHLYIFLFIGN